MDNQYDIYFGTIRGVFGHTQFRVEKPSLKFDSRYASKDNEIVSVETGRVGNEILIGYKSGIVAIYDTNLSDFTNSFESFEGAGPIIGAEPWNDKLIVARRSGHLNVVDGDSTESFKIDFKPEGTLDCMKLNRNRKNVIGVGGENNDFKLWDLETKKCIFAAKSMGHDKLNLPIPTSVRGITFFPNEEKLNAIVTKEGHVLLYDERVQRRPINKFIESKASYTTVTNYNDYQCMVGTTKGYMQLIDLKSPGRCVKTFKGFTGSVASIACEPTNSLVFSVSLDRYLRVHNVNTKELLHKEYLKQNLTKILVRQTIKEEVEDKEEIPHQEDVDNEYDQLFNDMEVIDEGKKRKSVKNSEEKNKKMKNK